jgi:hypothetical protein
MGQNWGFNSVPRSCPSALPRELHPQPFLLLVIFQIRSPAFLTWPTSDFNPPTSILLPMPPA